MEKKVVKKKTQKKRVRRKGVSSVKKSEPTLDAKVEKKVYIVAPPTLMERVLMSVANLLLYLIKRVTNAQKRRQLKKRMNRKG